MLVITISPGRNKKHNDLTIKYQKKDKAFPGNIKSKA